MHRVLIELPNDSSRASFAVWLASIPSAGARIVFGEELIEVDEVRLVANPSPDEPVAVVTMLGLLGSAELSWPFGDAT